MAAKFIDTHFHLDLFENPVTLAREIEGAKVYTIAVTNAPSVFHYTEKLAIGKKYFRAAIGLHPELALAREGELPQMWDCMERTRYVGEIGLDYKALNSEQRKRQRKIFSSILERSAGFGDKILSIHSRGCAEDVIAAIGSDFPGQVILHWYTGNTKNLKLAIRHGFYFSANLKMATSISDKRNIAQIPFDRLLTESDGPFVSSGPIPDSPHSISRIIEKSSEIKVVLPGLARRKVFGNFSELLG